MDPAALAHAIHGSTGAAEPLLVLIARSVCAALLADWIAACVGLSLPDLSCTAEHLGVGLPAVVLLTDEMLHRLDVWHDHQAGSRPSPTQLLWVVSRGWQTANSSRSAGVVLAVVVVLLLSAYGVDHGTDVPSPRASSDTGMDLAGLRIPFGAWSWGCTIVSTHPSVDLSAFPHLRAPVGFVADAWPMCTPSMIKEP